MILKQLQTFQEAARCGNFSDAARRLHLTQSAVSHQVKALEQVLGVKLYERHRRGIMLTGPGKEVLAISGALDKKGKLIGTGRLVSWTVDGEQLLAQVY